MISPRLTHMVRTLAGNKVRGLFSDPQDFMEGENIRARRIFRTSGEAPVATGEVIRDGSGSYLLFEHSRDTSEVRFLAFMITHHLPGSRQTNGVDPVTRMPRAGGVVSLGANIPVVVEPMTVSADKEFERVKYTIRAPGAFKAGDLLGDYTVHTVKIVPGASIIGAF